MIAWECVGVVALIDGITMCMCQCASGWVRGWECVIV